MINFVMHKKRMTNGSYMDLSIIIPVYNLGDYIAGCLDSILTQDVSDRLYEIILVDDGSTDMGPEIMRRYSSSHGNIWLISKPNGGVSSARNKGMEIARGRYITFVDADDQIVMGSLNQVISRARSTEDDLVILRMSSGAGLKERYSWIGKFLPDRSYSPKEILDKGYFRGSACSCLFSRDALKNSGISLNENLSRSEDTLFVSQFIAANHSISFADIPFYQVTERVGSASRQLSENFLRGYGHALQAAEDFLSSNDVSCPEWIQYFKYQIFIRIASVASALGINAKKASSLSGHKGYLPIKTYGIVADRWKILILNISYPLFQFLIKLRDRAFNA